MIKWLLDTNACIAIMNNNPPSVKAALIQKQVAEVAISAISLYELQYGVAKSVKTEHNQKTLSSFLRYIQVLEWTEQCAEVAGKLRADLKKTGDLIGPYDLLIATHALATDTTLVTNNTKEFMRVKALSLVDWVNT